MTAEDEKPRKRRQCRGEAAAERKGERYLKNREAAAYLNVSESWLNKSRITGTGPAFIKIGSGVLYAVEDLDAFAASRRVRSTSERAR